MEKIILDTGIFIKENFLHGKKINSLISLSRKKIIEIYITEITYYELKNNFTKSINQAVTIHNKFVKQYKVCVLKNSENSYKLFEKINKTLIENEFLEKLDKLIENNIIKLIPYSTINIGIIFDKYFQGLAPFGNGNKKSEFPDAFSLELIKDFLNANSSTAIIFSTDNDFIKCSSPSLEIKEEYDTYLNDKLDILNKERTDILSKLFIDEQENLKEHLTQWYKSTLDDSSYYHDIVHGKEIYDLLLDNVVVGELEYSIVSIEEDDVTIEVIGDVKIEVSLLIDDEDTMYYDSDYKSYDYLESNYEDFNLIFKSSMIVKIEIIPEEGDHGDFEVESINDVIKFNLNSEDVEVKTYEKILPKE